MSIFNIAIRRLKFSTEIASKSSVMLFCLNYIQNVVFIVNQLVEFRSCETILTPSKNLRYRELPSTEALVFDKVKIPFWIYQLTIDSEFWRSRDDRDVYQWCNWYVDVRYLLLVGLPNPVEVNLGLALLLEFVEGSHILNFVNERNECIGLHRFLATHYLIDIFNHLLNIIYNCAQLADACF